MRCPNCQTINPAEAKFCMECGNRLVVCPNCGTINLPEAKFCMECGFPLAVSSESTRAGGDTRPMGDTRTQAGGIRAEASSAPTNRDAAPPRRLVGAELASALDNSTSALDNSTSALGTSTSALGNANLGNSTPGNSNSTPGNSALDNHTAPVPTFPTNRSQTQPLVELRTPEERRVVTVMFADITGSTPLASGLDPEDMRAILAGYFNLMTTQIRKHAGTVEKYIGDAVMAVFGLPIAHEDDPDRAIRAALDMQQALADFNAQRLALDPQATRLQMRIGINTGEVAAPAGGPPRQDFLITGDAVNVAARLQQVANPDTILVGERTYLATRDVFDFHALAPLHVRGKAQPLRAWVVQGQRIPSPAIPQHPRGINGLHAPLVGRTLELTLIHTTYARVLAEQQPHLITIVGPPGIGKSRLAREFIAGEEEAARCTSGGGHSIKPLVLEGRCPPYGSGITYWPLIEILRTLLGARDGETEEELRKRFITFASQTLTTSKRSEDPEEIANAIARSIGSGLSGQPMTTTSDLGIAERLQRDRQRGLQGKNTAEQSNVQTPVLRAWRVLFEALAAQQPLILVIEDLQWADEALLDLLEYLADRLTNVPVLFLCPSRSEFLERHRDWGGGRRNFTTIALEALSREETGELVSELLHSSELPEALYHTILSRAEGNPFFVEEIVRMLIDQGVLVYEDGSWHVGTQNETLLSELATPAPPPEDTLIEPHYMLPLPLIPDTIQGVLAARVDLLSQIEKRVLQHAAIIGRTFWLSALLELAFDLDADTVVHALDSLMQRDFIIETEQQQRSPVEHDRVFSFKHVLIRDVVYNNIPRVRRSLEHAQVAQWLEKHAQDELQTFSELLAYHYQQALATWSATLLPGVTGTSDAFEPANHSPRLSRAELRERAIKYLTMAGDQAYHSYHTIRAIQAYSQSLELLKESNADSLTRARMRGNLGDAYMQRDSANEAWQEYRHALRLLQESQQDDRTMLLHLYDRLAELGSRWLSSFTTMPDMQEVRCYIDAGMKLLEGEPENADLAAFLTYRAFWYIQMYSFEVPERSEFANLALQSALEAQRIADATHNACVQWITLDALGFIYLEQRKYQDAHEAAHRRLQLVDQMPEQHREELSDLYYSLGLVHEAISDYFSAVKWFGDAAAIAQTMESPNILVVTMLGRMYAWYEWNRWNEAQEVAYKVLRMIEQYQLDEMRQLWALETLAVIAYHTGNQEEGDRYAQRFQRLLEQHFEREDEGHVEERITTKMHSIYLASEDWTHAIESYRLKLQRSEPLPSPAVLSTYAELSVMNGANITEQEELVERAVSVATEAGDRKMQAVAWRARARLCLEQHRWNEAEQDLQRALKRFEELDLPWEQGRTLYVLGLLYRRRAGTHSPLDTAASTADQGRAHNYLERALGFFESLHAVPDADRARLGQSQLAPV